MINALLDALGGHALLAYAGVLGVLLLCGLGLPLPEDVVLITGGYLSHEGHARLGPMLVVGFVGILLGDSIIFFAGRRLGARFAGSRLMRRILSAEKQERVQEYFGRWGNLIVIAARFMPGLRAPTYFTCGGTRMPYWQFLMYDGMAALVSAPLWVILGHIGGDSIHAVIEATRPIHWAILTVVGGGTAVFVGYRWWMARRERMAPAIQPPPAP